MKEKNERFLLKAKKWTIFDCFGIVFKASPVYASISILCSIVLAMEIGTHEDLMAMNGEYKKNV